jgi:hypothetical protein
MGISRRTVLLSAAAASSGALGAAARFTDHTGGAPLIANRTAIGAWESLDMA